MPKHLGVAAALAAFPPTGIFGVDKYYVSWGEKNGAWKLGLVQTVLSIIIIGLIVSVPWMYLSTFVLIVAILWGGVPSLYPSVEWAPVSSTDKIVAGVIVGLYILGMVVAIVRKKPASPPPPPPPPPPPLQPPPLRPPTSNLPPPFEVPE